MQIIEDAKRELNDFYCDGKKYREKVDALSNAMGFEGDFRFQSTYMPTYYAGDLSKENMIVIVGANPGWNDKGNVIEENLKRKDYFGFSDHFFTEFFNNGMKSRYYESSNRIGGLIKGLTGEQANGRAEIYRVLQNHVINIDMIPYHSKRFAKPADNPIANDYLAVRKEMMKKYIAELNKPRLLIFNSAITKTLLDFEINKNCYLSFPRNNNRENKMYMFEYNGVRSVYFDAQVGSIANPTTGKDMIAAADFILEAEKTNK